MGAEPCEIEGEQRRCQNRCGEGIQICRDGYFLPCDVPPTSRVCSNTCGAGLAWCNENRWGDCEVELTERPCSNDCGTGIEQCSDDAWGSCEVPRVELPCLSACGTGYEICEDGVWYACDAPQPNPPILEGVIRDFRIAHPDFEREEIGSSIAETGIVEPELGEDGTPVYAHPGATVTVTSPASFAEWYHDVPDVNLATDIAIQLEDSPEQPGLYIYENRAFFPIDNHLFGNEGNAHNYHFTLAVATEFVYVGGEVFSFSGDDDMWVFINRRLAIDLGGVHVAMSAEVALDEIAERFGLVVGERHPLHFFFAERHTVDSNFTIRTSIADIGSCPNHH